MKDSLDEIDKYVSLIKSQKIETLEIIDTREIEFTHHSTKIEGSQLSLKETSTILKNNLHVTGKGAFDNEYVKNHHQALSYVKACVSSNDLLTKHKLLEIHQLVHHGFQGAGMFRDKDVIVGEHIPPSHYDVTAAMDSYFETYKKKKDTNIHPIILAAEMKFDLVTIHPFIDGNGRTSRLIMNYILMQKGYPLVNIKGDYAYRESYYQALQAAQRKDNPDKKAFTKYFISVTNENYRSIINSWKQGQQNKKGLTR